MRCTAVSMLAIFWSFAISGQSTTIGLKIGNNGNISFNNKYKSGQYSELNKFGNGYQGGVYVNKRLFSGLALRGEFSYVNSSFEIDHESYYNGDHPVDQRSFYEEIIVNTSAFNLSGNAVLDLGKVQIGIGPELSLITQASGRGIRYHYEEPEDQSGGQSVQYRFFANRKQVYNRKNEEEKFAYDANRIAYGLDANISIEVIRPFSVQLKTFIPMTDFIEDFIGFTNNEINQKTINAQVSIVYTFEYLTHKSLVRSRRPSKKRR